MQRSSGKETQSTRMTRIRQMAKSMPQTLLFAGMISLGHDLLAQDVTTDAQVEANVLKALAGASDLASQSISTQTVYGVVTLSGTVQTETSRVEAENLAANAKGVKKVVDELQIGAQSEGQNPSVQGAMGTDPQEGVEAKSSIEGMVLQSDGTYAPASAGQPSVPAPGSAPARGAVMNDPDHDQAQYSQQDSPPTQQPTTQPSSPQPGKEQAPGVPVPYGQTPSTPPYRASSNTSQPAPVTNGYPTVQRGYPSQNRYPSSQQNRVGNGQPWGGQTAGQTVVIPAGALVRIRLDRFLASDKLKPGDVFGGFAANDVVAGGFVAIPRGAELQGRVIDSKSSGAVSGRGELALQLSSVTLAGRVYPVATDTWAQSGPSKTGQTVGNAAGFGVAGALIGAIVGRGAGAAIGAGVGAAAGVGASAASGRGQVVVPAEGMLTFHLAEPAEVFTVSEQEMQRLAYGVPSGQPESRQPLYPRPYPVYGYPPMPQPYGYPAY